MTWEPYGNYWHTTNDHWLIVPRSVNGKRSYGLYERKTACTLELVAIGVTRAELEAYAENPSGSLELV